MSENQGTPFETSDEAVVLDRGDTVTEQPDTSEQRFWARVDVSGDCWLFLNGGTGEPVVRYGHFDADCVTWLAHRYAYTIAVGPIPDGMTLDHVVCRTKACVRPDHLEVVTPAENTRRWAASIVSCPQGHPYDDNNTHIDSRGRRGCYTCRRARSAAWHQAQKVNS